MNTFPWDGSHITASPVPLNHRTVLPATVVQHRFPLETPCRAHEGEELPGAWGSDSQPQLNTDLSQEDFF